MGSDRKFFVRGRNVGLYLAIALVLIGFSVGGCAHPRAATTTHPSAPTTRLLDPAPAQTVLPDDVDRIPFRLMRNLVFVDVQVAGTTAPFMIDTGADIASITPWLASKERLAKFAPIGAPPLHMEDGTGAVGKEEVPLTHVPSIIMGRTVLKNFDVAIDDTRFFHMGGPANGGGVLGWPVFKGVLLTIDYPNQELIIRKGELPPADGHRVLQIQVDREGMLSIPVTVGGKEIRVYPDIGYGGGLNLTASQADGLQWHFPRLPFPSLNSVRTTIALAGELKGNLFIGDSVLEDPFGAVDAAVQYGSLGYWVLNQFAVTFDFKNMRMQLDPNPPARLALFDPLAITCDHRKVLAVDPNSIADKAGIRVGDEVVAMNGQPIDPSWSEAATQIASSVTGPATITGPALVNGERYALGTSRLLLPNQRAVVAYPGADKTGPATVEAEGKPSSGFSNGVTNWGAYQSGPLVVELQRQGRRIWIAVPLKPFYASTQPASGFGDQK